MTPLFDGAVKAAIVLAAGLAGSVLLARRSAALRHWVLTMSLAAAWLVPFLSIALPLEYPLPLWLTPAATRMAPATSAHRPVAETPDSVRVSTAFIARTRRPARAALPGTVVLGLVWLAGSLVSGAVLAAGLVRLRWLRSRARRAPSEPWRTGAHGLAARDGWRVRLIESDHPSLLVTWGWRRPTLLLPAGASGWPVEEVRTVLEHEFAHIARHDWTVQMAAEGLRVLYWFNPLVWIVCRRLRIESERACDDAVIAAGLDGSTYAARLVEVARRLQTARAPSVPAPAMARPSSFEGRVRAMLNPTLRRTPPTWKSRLASAAALLCLSVTVAGLRAQSAFYAVSGTVLDATGRALPGTTVVLTNGANRAKYEVTSDGAGRFEFAGVPPASYALEASLLGFAPLKDAVTIGGPTVRDLRLRVGSLVETITVTDRPAPTAPPDPAASARREESRRRFADMQRREQERCAGGGASSDVGGRILPPAKLEDVRPAYPDQMRAAKIGGVVTMTATIGVDGAVQSVTDLKGPHPDLEAAAAAAVRQWRFSPTLLNCDPIDVEMSVTTLFRLEP